VSACGPASHSGTVTTSNPTQAASTTPQATPVATPTPPPPPLLIVEQSPPAVVAAMTADGTPQWSFKPSTVVGDGSYAAEVAGSHLVLFGDQSRGGQVAVVDRAGVVVGPGSYSSGSSFSGEPRVEPSGTRWTWSTVDNTTSPSSTSTATPTQTGAIWVAGIGEAPHRVRTWTEPGAFETPLLWSDQGIVIAVSGAGCGPYMQEFSTFVFDPATGRTSPLFGNDRHVTDVHAGIVAAIRGPNVMLVSGGHTLTVPEQPATKDMTIVNAAVSPDGAHVLGTFVGQPGCGGDPAQSTLVTDVASGRTTVLPGIFADRWYDDSHLVVSHGGMDRSGAPYNELRIVDLGGAGAGPLATHSWLLGVLR
jgi:hypothetical protein